jgi:hypothetical protein
VLGHDDLVAFEGFIDKLQKPLSRFTNADVSIHTQSPYKGVYKKLRMKQVARARKKGSHIGLPLRKEKL